MQTLLSPRGGVWGLTFSPDGDMLAGVGRNALYCWTRSRGWEQTGLREEGIRSATFHPDGRSLAYFATSLRELVAISEIRLYSLTPECRTEPERLRIDAAGEPSSTTGPWLRQVAFTPDGCTLVTNQFESRGLFYSPAAVVLYWHLTPDAGGWRVGEPVRTVAPNGAALVGDSTLVLVGQWGVRVCPLDPAASGPLTVPDVSRGRAVAVSPRGEVLAVADEHRVRVWHLRTAAPVATWKSAPPGAPEAFSPDGRTLASTTGEDGVVTFLDPLTGRAGQALDFRVGPVQSLAYAPDGLTLAVAGRSGLVVVDTE